MSWIRIRTGIHLRGWIQVRIRIKMNANLKTRVKTIELGTAIIFSLYRGIAGGGGLNNLFFKFS
jgi:hypothetical protein